jgi:hypothetical protein
MGDEPDPFAEESIQVILDKDPELPVNGDRRQPRITCLLKAFDEQRTVRLFSQDVRVEVVTFDAFGVGQDDLPDTECRELCPQASHHFRARQSKQHIDLWTWGNCGFELAAQRDASVSHRGHCAHPERTVQHSDSNRLSRRHVQHVEQMRRARIRQSDALRVDAIVLVEQQQVHVVSQGRQMPIA